MKKYLLYINLLALIGAVWTLPALAEKKYRYIKREHGVRFQGNIPITVRPSFNLTANLKGAYAYNWKGFVEAGPYFQLELDAAPSPRLSKWAVGLMGEYNFIKNRGKRKLIPSLGLQLGLQGLGGLQGTGGVHGSLKWFVAKRTAFITDLQYDLMTPFTQFSFASMEHQVNVSMGFSYYFDFY